MITISFRVLRDNDMPMLLGWLQWPHVKQWWNDGDDTLEKVKSHYTANSHTTKRFLLLHGEGTQVPIGYFQYYITPTEIGVDQFIAEESLLGKGIGSEAIGRFIDLIQQQHGPRIILTDPSPDNKRAIRCYEKVGFRHRETVQGQKGNLVYLMDWDLGLRR